MQSPVVHSPRKPRRVPGLWLSVLLALAVHAGMGLALFLDDTRPRSGEMASMPAPQGFDPTARMGGAPAPGGASAGSADAGAAPESLPAVLPRAALRVPGKSAGAEVRPSFDCSMAQSLTEDLICSDPELARLDRDLARLYARAKFVARDPVGFREQTHDAWRRREETCSDRDCLREWYAQRRKQLNEVIARSGR